MVLGLTRKARPQLKLSIEGNTQELVDKSVDYLLNNQSLKDITEEPPAPQLMRANAQHLPPIVTGNEPLMDVEPIETPSFTQDEEIPVRGKLCGLSKKISKPEKRSGNRRRSRGELKVEKVTYIGLPQRRAIKNGSRIKKTSCVQIRFIDQDGIERKANINFGDPKKSIPQSRIGTFKGNINQPRFWELNYLPLGKTERLSKLNELCEQYNLNLDEVSNTVVNNVQLEPDLKLESNV